MLVQRSSQGLVYYASPLLESAGVPHGFSTRVGGVSPAPFDSLNLGISRDADAKDSSANVNANYQRFLQAIGCADRARAWVSQVHGNGVCAIRTGEHFESGCQADALVSDDPARVISVKYADCVPILLATRDGTAVAAVHAGWRGVVAGVVPAAVQRLREISDGPLLAAVGPCICVDHFEVGPEVIEAFARLFGDAPGLFYRTSPKGRVNLRGCVRRQLELCGIMEIDVSDSCTFEDRAAFYSHRRDGAATGRMAGAIGARLAEKKVALHQTLA